MHLSCAHNIPSALTYVKECKETHGVMQSSRNIRFDTQEGSCRGELPAQAFEAGMRKYDHADDDG